MNKLRIGVFMGGKSQEREVSFNSGRTVCDHLDTTRYDIIPIFQKRDGTLFILPWHFLHRGKTSDFEHRLDKEAQLISWSTLKSHIDFIYLAMHGRYAEDGTMQGMLELLEIPYLGSKIYASALCMEKHMANKQLKAHGIAVPPGIMVTPREIKNSSQQGTQKIIARLEAAHVPLPLIVKPHCEGSSLGVSAIFDLDELQVALEHACYIQPGIKQPVLIEEKIEGMEFSCIIITNYRTNEPIVMPPTEIVAEDNTHVFDYTQKYMPGRALEFTPARCGQELNKKIQDECLKTMRILDMKNFVRIDGFLTKNNDVVIVDANTITGMAPSSFFFREAAEIGMSQGRLINHLIETELHQDPQFQSFLKQFENKVKDGMDTRKKVAVLLGGQSNEKEISLESGRNVFYKLSSNRYEPIAIFISKTMEPYIINERLLLRHATHEIEYELTDDMKISWDELAQRVDFAFIALHGGAGENGIIQGALEMLDIPYNGSGILASSLCMDKFKTAEFLRNEGFETPQSFLIAKSTWQQNKHETICQITKKIEFPFIVKPHDDGCSVMVQKVAHEQEYTQGLDELFARNKEYALIEEYLTGMELTVGVIGNEHPRALPPSQAIVQDSILSIQEKFLPGAGENQTPAPLSPAATKLVQQTMEQVFTAIGCRGYARIDCFYQDANQSPTGKERVVILEVNSLPALTPATCLFHQAAEVGIKPMDFIDIILQLGLNAHGKTSEVPDIIDQLMTPKTTSQQDI